jgi:hypothetical protein
MARFPALLCLITILASACSTGPPLKTYKGPDRPASELVLLKCDHGIRLGHSYKPWVCAVDGFERLNDSGGPVIFPSVHVLPGRRTVVGVMGRQSGSNPGNLFTDGLAGMISNSLVDSTFNALTGTVHLLGTGRKRITFTAKLGHKYVLKGDVDEPKFWIWVEDAESDEVVGGKEPPP